MNTRHAISISLLAVLSMGCLEPGDPVYGESFPDDPFVVFDPTVGVFPYETVLEDPNNPFANVRAGDVESVFEIEANDPYHVTAFYVWATALARIPMGESQFYAAANLQEIWESGNASQEDLATIRQMAIDGYTQVLTAFPDAGTFDETGTIRFELLTPAYQGILALEGEPPAGWVVVTDNAGIPRAVKQ